MRNIRTTTGHPSNLLLLLCGLCLAGPAAAVEFTEADWTGMAGWAGANGPVTAAATDANGHLYIGGPFTAVGKNLVSGSAKWDGSKWSPLGLGLGQVHALAAVGTNVYGGGYFTTITNGDGSVVTANCIAKWDGSSWSALGQGLNGIVNALAILGDNLYVGGEFSRATNSNGVTVSVPRIAKWDGTNWSALGGGLWGGAFAVYAIAVSGSSIFVGGTFSSATNGAEGVNCQSIAKWNGTTWSSVGSGMPRFTGCNDTSVRALATSGPYLYVGGNLEIQRTDGSLIASFAARWNGSSWSALGSGVDGYVEALAISGSDLYVGGSFGSAGGKRVEGIARWNGSSWFPLGTATNCHGEGGVRCIAVLHTDVYVGGAFRSMGGRTACNIAKWNGSAWSPTEEGLVLEYGASSVSAVSATEEGLYIAGDFWITSGAKFLAKWHGTGWSRLSPGTRCDSHPSWFRFASARTNLYVAEYYGCVMTNTDGTVAGGPLVKWDGVRWSGCGSGVNGHPMALATSGTDLYVGGEFTTAGGVPANNIAKWDGVSWSALGAGIGSTYSEHVKAVAVSGKEVYAGGSFFTAGGVPAANIAKWEGSNWSPLGSGIDGSVGALVVHGTNLYAGGSFTNAGGTWATNIARWDGTTWHSLGSGVLGGWSPVYAMAVCGNTLFVGGGFWEAGGFRARGLAAWSGNQWFPISDGPNKRIIYDDTMITGLSVLSGNLYVSGSFGFVGNKVAVGIARLSLVGLQAHLQNCRFEAGRFRFDLDGEPGQTVVIESSTDLQSWIPLGTNILGTTPVPLCDPQSPPFTARFYRLSMP